MYLFRLRLILLAIIAQLLSIGCAFNIETSHINDLDKFANANVNLFKTLRCLHGKVYPNDVDDCGTDIFGTESQLTEVETCLRAQKVKKNVRQLTEDPIQIGLTADCRSGRILVLFRKLGDEYVVHDVGFLMDWRAAK